MPLLLFLSFVEKGHHHSKQRYLCKDCGKDF
ncbi:transposase-like zinc-binding domain-containing protein [Trichocoleus desertorum]